MLVSPEGPGERDTDPCLEGLPVGGPSSGETGRVLSEGTQYRVYLKTKKNSVKKQKPLKEMGVTRCTGGNVRRSSEGSGLSLIHI